MMQFTKLHVSLLKSITIILNHLIKSYKYDVEAICDLCYNNSKNKF